MEWDVFTLPRTFSRREYFKDRTSVINYLSIHSRDLDQKYTLLDVWQSLKFLLYTPSYSQKYQQLRFISIDVISFLSSIHK